MSLLLLSFLFISFGLGLFLFAVIDRKAAAPHQCDLLLAIIVQYSRHVITFQLPLELHWRSRDGSGAASVSATSSSSFDQSQAGSRFQWKLPAGRVVDLFHTGLYCPRAN